MRKRQRKPARKQLNTSENGGKRGKGKRHKTLSKAILSILIFVESFAANWLRLKPNQLHES